MIAAPPDAGLLPRSSIPSALATWLPPTGMTGRFERFDLRPGGSYRLVLTYADTTGAPGKATAESDIVEARFVDVVPDVRVVQAVDFVSDDPAFAGTMTMTWEVVAVEGGTRVEITAPTMSRRDLGRGPRRRTRVLTRESGEVRRGVAGTPARRTLTDERIRPARTGGDLHEARAPGGIRTHTAAILSRLPLANWGTGATARLRGSGALAFRHELVGDAGEDPAEVIGGVTLHPVDDEHPLDHVGGHGVEAAASHPHRDHRAVRIPPDRAIDAVEAGRASGRRAREPGRLRRRPEAAGRLGEAKGRGRFQLASGIPPVVRHLPR